MNTSMADSPEKPKRASTKKHAPERFWKEARLLPTPWNTIPTATPSVTTTTRCSRSSAGWRSTLIAIRQYSARSSAPSCSAEPFQPRSRRTDTQGGSDTCGGSDGCDSGASTLAHASRSRSTARSSPVRSSRWSARLKPSGHGDRALAHSARSSSIGPTQTGAPACMSSALCSSSKVRCAGWWIESITTRSCAASMRSVLTSRCADELSSPEVGSSSRSTRGEETIDMAMATRRRSPPDTRWSAAAEPPSRVFAMWARPSDASVASTTASLVAALDSRGSVSAAANETHSRGVSVIDRLSSCRT
mmetsp:Transcript_2422/g.6294  ORF Transcript_2422/g.6294 Transcript_2422/m.6294 type:complete len:304 (-) Transcript_2422:2243-3154(-)